ncbi:Putative SKP1/BTB/POZ domain superfamily protein [Colletotrichum destructivum]|uniref:SKP1/BTB/POZ domain superfamily protein n=1 Tax=Colletotrichum destructivum TaxID=34406 RepID=A0AAX4IR91_9PEZI|nr:Putative SKP1/BTB/POZ domain superfamily protein [Colletotrichum destructivum]
MMSGKGGDVLDMEKVLQSRTVKFIVGCNEKEFSVHEFSFCSISPALRALLTGGMKESVEGKVVWDDVEPATFTDNKVDSLKSYLQSDAYQGAQHQFSKKCSTQPLEPEIGQGSHPKNGAAYLRSDWLEDLEFSKTGIADVFMSQAKLYILADKYGIEGLRSLCLHRLQQSLLHCLGTSEFENLLLDVIEFVFSKTRP